MISYDLAAKKLVLRQFNIERYVNLYVLDSVSADGRICHRCHREHPRG